MTTNPAPRPDWHYRQSAVLPYRQGPDGLEVLLVTSRKGTRWVPPKGIVEPGMTPPQSAAKEAREEAGIEGPIAEQSLGTYDHKKWGGTCRVEVFAMEVRVEARDWPEMDTRRREWMTLAEASTRVGKASLADIIQRLPDMLAANCTGGPPSTAPSRDGSSSPIGPGRKT